MTKETTSLGQKGEDIARVFLIRKGFEILETNWRYGKQEIDIIAEKENQLVVVEVKTRSYAIYEPPEDSITDQKIRFIVDAAEHYIIENDIDMDTRFDVISIKWYNDEKYEIDHREDAFEPPVN